MWPLAVVVVMGSVIGLLRLSNEVMFSPLDAKASITTTANNMIIYKGAVDAFVATQASGYTAPAVDNAVPDASLSLPGWYIRNPLWTNKVISGTVTVYSTAIPPEGDISREMARLAMGSRYIGVRSTGGTILSPLYGDTGITLPVGIPADVPVIQSKIN